MSQDIAAAGLVGTLKAIKDKIDIEDASEEEFRMLEMTEDVIQQTGDMMHLVSEMRAAGGPESLMGLIRYYMQKYKVGIRRLSIATTIKPDRLKVLCEDLDGPTPWEFEMMSKFFLPKLAEKPKSNYLERKREKKQKRLAEKENRKHPRPETNGFI